MQKVRRSSNRATHRRRACGHDERDADLAEHGIGYAQHRDLRDRRMLRQHALDLGRVHVVAAADVHLAAPPDERQVAALVEEAEIAGREPAVGAEDLGGALRVVPVAAHHRVGAAAHPARRRPVGHRRPSSSTTSSSTFTRGRPTVCEITSGESPGTVPVVIAASVLV